MSTSKNSRSLHQAKADLLNACQDAETEDSKCLQFGNFTLKSGRLSPYFFNLGSFNKAKQVNVLATAYAETLASHEPSLQFDVLFGPAFKGIPLCVMTVQKLAEIDPVRFGDVAYCFDRKEQKTYGDKGVIVGADLKGKRVVVIDDVITAGTAMREAVSIIQKQGGSLESIIVAIDRMEKTPTPTDDDGVPGPSAIGAIRKEFRVPVAAILTLNDILDMLRTVGDYEDFKRLDEYRARYRASD